MLVEFALDAEAIQDTDRADPEAAADLADVITDTLLRYWERHGVILSPSVSELSRRVRKLTNREARELWQDILVYIESKAAPDTSLSMAEVRANWKESRFLINSNKDTDGAEIHFIARAKAQNSGVPERGSTCIAKPTCKSERCLSRCDCRRRDKQCKCEETVNCECVSRMRHCKELTTLTNIVGSKKFENLESLALEAFPSQNPMVELWEDRLEPLASYSTRMVIVDRYALTTIAVERDGLKTLLEKIDNCGSVERVRLYASMGPEIRFQSPLVPELEGRPRKSKDKRKAAAARREKYKRRAAFIRRQAGEIFRNFTNIKELEIFLPVSFGRGNKNVHARHVRFDENRICTIDLGASEGIRATRPATFSYLVGPRQTGLFRNNEKTLCKETIHESNRIIFPPRRDQAKLTT